MKINIQTPGFNAKPGLMGYVQEKIEKLSRFKREIIAGGVVLRLDNSDTKENKLCEIKLAIPGNDLMGGAKCKTFEEAVSKAVDIIRGQMKRRKTKIIGTRNDISPYKTTLLNEPGQKHA